MITKFNPKQLKDLYLPPPTSHKGQNGKLMVIGGSHLFHAASLWALEMASKIVDLVFYSSVPENLSLLEKLKIKGEFRNGIIVPQNKREEYIKEADAILIGPGMPRVDGAQDDEPDTKTLTEKLLQKFPEKKWVLDAGALQTVDAGILKKLSQVILTPHLKEFCNLFKIDKQIQVDQSLVVNLAKEFNVTILLKGKIDIVCNPDKCRTIWGGNAGMTKGGTGDVLAGLVAAFFCRNEGFTSAVCASYINKVAGDSLFEKVGYWYNASNLLNEIPSIMKKLILNKNNTQV